MLLGKKGPQESGNSDIDIPQLQEGEMAKEKVHWTMKTWSEPDGGNNECKQFFDEFCGKLSLKLEIGNWKREVELEKIF